MIEGYDHPKYGPQAPLSRGVVNQRSGRVKRAFKWAVENEMVPASVYHGLLAVRGLQRGRSGARETEPVRPVSPAVVEETLRFLNRYLAAMVRVQLLSGARPGEVVIMRACDLDMTGRIWLYRPVAHKTAHHGHQRVIALGPQAQAVIKPLLVLDTRAYLFSPRQADRERQEWRRRERKTPITPSQAGRRRKTRPEKSPGERYSTGSYAHAVRAAVGAANRGRACDLCKGLEPAQRCAACQQMALPYWHPHQLRHTRATEIRREYGIDVARAILGHRSPAVTETYAEIDLSKAVEVMARLG
jgi:integrase